MKYFSDTVPYFVDMFTNDTILNLSHVFYGDQLLIPSSKVLCIEPDTRVTNITGANRLTEVDMTIAFILYYDKVQNYESNRSACDLLTDQIAHKLNSLNDIEGQVVHSYVSRISPDYTRKTNENIYAISRIEFIINTRERLGE